MYYFIVLEDRSLKPVSLRQNQGVDRATLPLEALGENPFLASSSFWWLLYSLAHGSITPGCLMRWQSRCQAVLQSPESLIGDRGSVSNFTHMVVMLYSLVRCWPNALVPHHMGLSSGLKLTFP